jgi:hypothetical protein
MRKSLWIVLSVLAVTIAAPIAHADTVFTVTGSFDNGAILSGTATIDTSAGLVTAFDLSTAGAFVSGPYTTVDPGQGPFLGIFNYLVSSTLPASSIDLLFPTSNLVGYAGGSLCSDIVTVNCTFVSFLNFPSGLDIILTSGSLTPQVTTPEPSSVGLMLLGVGLVFAMRKRIAPGLSRAS